MPRTARQTSKTGVYHVMLRGNELRDVFIDDEDRNRFLQTLMEKAKDENFQIYAYCLMDNHIHLLLSGMHDKLGKLIKRINTSYVYYFNKKYGRVGHLFHDRYKSEPVESEEYLLEAIRYIHNNPVKAGMVKGPGKYEWSSYHYYTGKNKPAMQVFDTSYILSIFSADIDKAIVLFKDYSNKQSDFVLADSEKKDKKDKSLKGEAASGEFIREYLKRKKIKLEDLKLKAYTEQRRELIAALKEDSDLSIRQIARILDLNRGVVQRA